MDRKIRNAFVAFLKRQSNKELIRMFDNALDDCLSCVDTEKMYDLGYDLSDIHEAESLNKINLELFDLIEFECITRNIDPYEYSEDEKNANS